MALVFQQDARLPGGGYWYDDQTGDIDRSGRNSVLAIGLFDFNLTNKPTQNAQTGVFEPTAQAPRQPSGRVPSSGIDPNRPLIGQGVLSPPPPGPPQPVPADQGARGAPAAAAPGAAGAAAVPTLRPVDQVVGAYARQHGIPISLPSKSDEFIRGPADPDTGLSETIENPNPTFHYTFPDGFTLDISLEGQVVKETDPSAARTRATEPIAGPGGTQWRLNPDTGQFEQVAPTPGTQGAALLQSQIEQNQAQTIQALAQMGVDYATAARIAAMTPAEVENEVAQGRLTRIQANIALTKLEPEVAQINAQTVQALTSAGVDRATAARIAAMTPAEVEQLVQQGRLTRAQADIALAKAGPEIAQIGAQTTQALEAAGVDRATAARIAAMTGPEIDELEARGELTRTQAQIARAKLGPELAQMGAETNLTNLQARLAAAQAALAEARLPSDLARAQAEVDQIHQNMAQVAQEMRRPVPVQASTDLPVVQYITPEGQIRSQRNEAFLPTTMAGVAALTGQLQAQGQQMADQLQQQVASGLKSREQADQELGDWQRQNQPIAEQAQQQILREQERLDMQRREAAVTAALGAGTQAISAVQTQLPLMAGPGYSEATAASLNALAQGREVPEGTFRPEMFRGPPMNIPQMAQDATMQALKLISPTAAAATGTPLPQLQGLDIAAMLGQTQWAGGQQQPQAPSQPAGQPSGQQPITINIGGAQSGQQTPTVPEPFIPRFPGQFQPAAGPQLPPQFTPATPASPSFQQAPGIGPQLPSQLTALNAQATPPTQAAAFQQASGIGPQLPAQTTSLGGTGNVFGQIPYADVLEAFRRRRYQPAQYQPAF